MKEYIKKGYARKLKDKEANTISPRTNYIPHHSVANINKPNKLRIVFDAATMFSNTCLNQHLLKGPDFLNSLIGILLRYREGQYAIIGDIEAMYHQVKVLKEDTDSLRFLWRENFSASIDEYIICDLLQEKGPSTFAFPTAFRCFQLSLTAFQKFDTKISYQN